MTVGIITNTYPPNLNGVSITTAKLVENLKQKGHRVFVATPKVEATEYPDYILPFNSLSLPKQIRSDFQIPLMWKESVFDFFLEHRVELIHSQDTFFGGMEAAQIAKELNIPAVHTYHTFIESYGFYNLPGYKTFIREFSKQTCNQYQHIIALSSKICFYLKELKIKAPISQFLNVTSLQDLRLLDFDHKFAGRHQINPEDFVIITFGRVAKEKGLIAALEVVAPLLQSHRNIKYLIVGQGSYAKTLRKKAIDLSISDQVILPGKYTSKNLSNWCSLAKFFLFTSTTENLPTTLLEAMYCGLPVVSIDDDSVDYILRHRENGIKAPLEKLSQFCGDLYSNPELLTKMSESALISAKEVASKDVTQDYINLYEQVLSDFRA